MNESMKIGIFTDCYYPQINGVVTSVLMLEEELIKLGHEVTIITAKVPNYTETKDNVIRIKSIPFSKWKEFRLGVPLYMEPYRQIKELDLDLIHTHTEFTMGIFGKFMAKSLDIPMIHTYHTMYEDYTHYVMKYGKKYVRKIIQKTSKNFVKKYDGIIAPTDKTKFALESYGVTNDIFVVPTGIDLRQFNLYDKSEPEVRQIMNQYGIEDKDHVILSLGRVSEEKSIHKIIESMPILLQDIENLKLVIVGDGPYKEKLEKLVCTLGLDGHVIFTGQVPFDHVSYYYSLADVFISASKTETQGLTIMEAMATGIPVVVYDDTNVTGVVMEGISGRLFKEDNELIDQVKSVFNDRGLTDTMAEQAKEIIKGLSKETYGKNAEDVYYKLMNASFDTYKTKLNA
jgi:1,2-diacylglycerol 3-alpha-glucosyltransferase